MNINQRAAFAAVAIEQNKLAKQKASKVRSSNKKKTSKTSKKR